MQNRRFHCSFLSKTGGGGGINKQEDEEEPVVSRVLFVTSLDAFVAKVARKHLSLYSSSS